MSSRAARFAQNECQNDTFFLSIWDYKTTLFGIFVSNVALKVKTLREKIVALLGSVDTQSDRYQSTKTYL